MTASTPTPAAAGQRVTASYLNQFIPGSWAAVTSFSNSWANRGGGSTPLSVRLINSVTVHIVGQINAGTLTSGTTIATLPASSWFPVTACVVPIWSESSGAPYGVFINNAGALATLSTFSSSASGFYINGTYALDI